MFIYQKLNLLIYESDCTSDSIMFTNGSHQNYVTPYNVCAEFCTGCVFSLIEVFLLQRNNNVKTLSNKFFATEFLPLVA